MIDKILIWKLIFRRVAHPCVVTDVVTNAWVGDVILNVPVVDMWSGVWVDVVIDVVFDICVEDLAAVNANILLAVMTDFWFSTSTPWAESIPFCWAAFSCWSIMTVLDSDRALHAWIPSYHVWWSFMLPAPPQVLNQAPPRAQQLIFPDFAMVPHFGHTELMVVVATDVYMWSLVKT